MTPVLLVLCIFPTIKHHDCLSIIGLWSPNRYSECHLLFKLFHLFTLRTGTIHDSFAYADILVYSGPVNLRFSVSKSYFQSLKQQNSLHIGNVSTVTIST